MSHPLRIVVIVPDLALLDEQEEHVRLQLERSRSLRVGLLEAQYDIVATLPADVFLSERIA